MRVMTAVGRKIVSTLTSSGYTKHYGGSDREAGREKGSKGGEGMEGHRREEGRKGDGVGRRKEEKREIVGGRKE